MKRITWLQSWKLDIMRLAVAFGWFRQINAACNAGGARPFRHLPDWVVGTMAHPDRRGPVRPEIRRMVHEFEREWTLRMAERGERIAAPTPTAAPVPFLRGMPEGISRWRVEVHMTGGWAAVPQLRNYCYIPVGTTLIAEGMGDFGCAYFAIVDGKTAPTPTSKHCTVITMHQGTDAAPTRGINTSRTP